MNGPQAPYIGSGFLKCISGINLSPPNKNVLYFFIQFISCINFLIPNQGILHKFVFIPKLLNNLQGSCSLINFGFLLSGTAK